MPLDHGGRLNQHHGLQGLWPNPVKPHPEEPVGAEEFRAARALAPQDRHLMPKGDEFQFQRGAATKTKREQGNDGAKDRDHADDGRATAR